MTQNHDAVRVPFYYDSFDISIDISIDITFAYPNTYSICDTV